LADLNRSDLKVALGEARGPAVGLVTDQMLEKAGLMSVRANAAGSFATVQAVAAQVALGNSDACIIWDTIARQNDFRDKLDVIAIPGAPVVPVVICRVNGGPNAALADEFIRLVAASAQGREAFTRYGFAVSPPSPSAATASAPAPEVR
jgi:molybdate transport system substrate-binding protein